MTRLPGFQVEALRAFRDRASLELKPLTLLYGWNQAGKSTLLRMLPTLADAIFEKTPIFDLTSPALFGSTFKELGWLGPEPNTSPLIRLEAPDTKAFIEIQLTEDQGIVPNRIRIGKGKDNYFDVSAAGHGSRTPKAYHAPYAGTSDGNEWSGDLKFTSIELFPVLSC